MEPLSVSLPSSPVAGRDEDLVQGELHCEQTGSDPPCHLSGDCPTMPLGPAPLPDAGVSSPTASGKGLGLLKMLSLGRAGHTKVTPVDAATQDTARGQSHECCTRQTATPVRKSLHIVKSPRAPMEPAVRCRIVRKGTMRPQYSCYLDDGSDHFLYTARRSLTAIRSWYTFFEDTSVGSREGGSVAQLRANLGGSEYMLFADAGVGEVQPGSPRSPRSRLQLETAAKCIVRCGKSFASVGEPGSRSLTVLLPGVALPDAVAPAADPEAVPSPVYSRSTSSPPSRQGGDSPGRFRTLALGPLPDGPEAAVPAGLVLETKSPVWSPTKKAYNLDFPKGRVTVASSKNLVLVPQRPPSVGPAPPLFLCGRTGKNTFAMDYTPPLTALQAFAIAIANLDNKLCYAI